MFENPSPTKEEYPHRRKGKKTPENEDLSSNTHSLSLKEEIENFIEERKISRSTMWRNPEFQKFYFSIKSSYADTLTSILNNDLAINEEILKDFSRIDPEIAQKYTKQLTTENKKLKSVFSGINNIPIDKQANFVIKKLNLEDVFAGTSPFFTQVENTLVALLDYEEYEKINGNSLGCFSLKKNGIPLISLKIYQSAEDFSEEYPTEMSYNPVYDELDFEQLFNEGNSKFTEEVVSGNLSDERIDYFLEMAGDFRKKYIPYIRGEKDAVKDEVDDLIYDEIIEKQQHITYKSWYAQYILELDCGNELSGDLLYDERPISSHILDQIQSGLHATLTHEKHHALNRFLPVNHARGINYAANNEDGKMMSHSEITQDWLHSFADEIIAFSYEKRMVPINTYLINYQQSSDFKNEEERKKTNKEFSEKVNFLRKINRKIICSGNYKKLACMFSLEDIRAWKFLDSFLENGSMPELRYNKINPTTEEEYYDLGLHDEWKDKNGEDGDDDWEDDAW